MRGNLRIESVHCVTIRSIPAHAGEPRWSGCCATWAGVYPAHAGEPVERLSVSAKLEVYPRTCGGTRFGRAVRGHHRGLSPHMRGNLAAVDDRHVVRGSIPAHAGEPQYDHQIAWIGRVYPRTCGGTPISQTKRLLLRGLSPHMRGNPSLPTCRMPPSRSIPAHAGEPVSHCRRCPSDRGLSPHMRGNLPCQRPRWQPRGSIPAHAGEPHQSTVSVALTQVYPRTCGGTVQRKVQGETQSGLSPHMRGNHDPEADGVPRGRSIPAHAGEPWWPRRTRARPRVYPRTCGGTTFWTVLSVVAKGLSPHMRGNPLQVRASLQNIRSIPAHAGEPLTATPGRYVATVYPRTCGGTAMGTMTTAYARGLSPHMRGNPNTTTKSRGSAGSIPAHAGEP